MTRLAVGGRVGPVVVNDAIPELQFAETNSGAGNVFWVLVNLGHVARLKQPHERRFEKTPRFTETNVGEEEAVQDNRQLARVVARKVLTRVARRHAVNLNKQENVPRPLERPSDFCVSNVFRKQKDNDTHLLRGPCGARRGCAAAQRE
jgi:hypothetical protein